LLAQPPLRQTQEHSLNQQTYQLQAKGKAVFVKENKGKELTDRRGHGMSDREENVRKSQGRILSLNQCPLLKK
jgi:hypothetical protein